MSTANKYDVCIIGGGLAGLSLAIQCAKANYKVVLFEKEIYPFHKVCGEYISMESWNFLENLGVPLSEMNLPRIKNLIVSAPGGKNIQQPLPLGGFGISRYALDAKLAAIAKVCGVTIFENTKVTDAIFLNDQFIIQTTQGEFFSKIVAGTFGKRSNLDIKWKRPFITQKNNKLNNYVGIKYHVKINKPADEIALHNFKNGYCGISKIEDDKYCLCYLTTAKNLAAGNNSICSMEKNILCRNPHLKKIFEEAEILYENPVTISQISFAKKEVVQDHIFFMGDAAGMISPLCGNGMSMAMHASKLAFEQIKEFLQGNISREVAEQNYVTAWTATFSKRLKAGRAIQYFFGSSFLSNLLITIVKPFPFIIRALIRSTHGKSF